MKDIEDIYPLTPMQELMLLHLLSNRGSKLLVEHFCCVLTGNLAVPALKKAWEHVIQRHSMLRTAFVSDGLERPLQVVRRQVTLPWEEQDWRGLSEGEQRERLEGILESARAQGFDPKRAPLMRLALIRVGEDGYFFIWMVHHILLDRWSLRVVLSEVLGFYDALSHGRHMSVDDPTPFRAYMDWLQRQDLSRARAYWSTLLDGYTPSSQLPNGAHFPDPSGPGRQYEHHRIQLDESSTAALRAGARRLRVTLNNVAQAAWALLLSRWSGRSDLVFGVTVSGRPPELPGAESIVGMLINSLPMRAHVILEEPLESWLSQFCQQQFEMLRYGYSPLALIHEWSKLPAGTPLFQSLLVFQNDATLRGLGPGSNATLDVQHLSSGFSQTGYPLTLMIGVDNRLSAVLTYDSRSFASTTITKMGKSLASLLRAMADNPARNLGRFLTMLDDFAAERRADVQLPASSAADRRDAGLSGDFARPSTPVQILVAGVWQEVLKVDQVGLYDNFLDIGGTSLSAMQSVIKLEKETGLRINPAEMMSQTLAQVAAVYERELAHKSSAQVSGGERKSRGFLRRLARDNRNG